MDWIDYFIMTSAIATVSLVWRMLLLDYPKFDSFVENIPFIGEGLVCSFCFPLWLTFVSLFFENPIADWTPDLSPGGLESVFNFLVAWMSVGFGVLVMRFLVVALMDGSAILSHKHRASHE